MGLEVHVDPELCIGSGDCVARAPVAFLLDEAAGVSVPREAAASAPRDLVVGAAMACPTQAISVHEDGVLVHAANG